MEGPEHRRVRGHRAEQIALESEVLDAGTALAGSGQHQRRVNECLSSIVGRQPFAGHCDPR